MTQPQKDPLRAMSEQEEREVQRLVTATSERLDVVRRAKALLAVARGQPFTQAAHEAGLKSGDGVGKLVKRFNEHGLAALSIAAGRGRQPTYTSEQQARILAEVQREPDRDADQTATWSLMTLRTALRKTGLPKIAAETIRQVLQESGYSYQRTRTWCRTGYALRKRQSGTVTVSDVETRGAKKTDRAGVRAGGSRRDRATQ
jgi:transposase